MRSGVLEMEGKGMSDEVITNRYVKQVYNDLDHYIVIGLTGRCGSGCSTTRDILCGEIKFNPEDFMGNIKLEADCNADRDKNTILNFAENNPLHFVYIKVRDILTSYILENEDAFFEILNQVYRECCGDGKKIKEDFYAFFNNNIRLRNGRENFFDEAISVNADIWGKINDNVYQFIQNISREQYDFLFSGLGEISQVIREFLSTYQHRDEYTTVYQCVGNIVRTCGSLKNASEYGNSNVINEEGMYAIAKRINLLLKIMRREQWIIHNYEKDCAVREKPVTKSKVHVVIDCIKNVFEAEYLRARYHSFYLVALTLDDEIRRQRLSIKKGLSNIQMELIDTREQPSKARKLIKEFRLTKKSKEGDRKQDIKRKIYDELFSGKSKYSELYTSSYENNTYTFRLQDVDSCIQNADILINNSGTKEDLGLILMRYVSLMQHPGLVPPTIDERCMQVAQSAKLNSGCISRQVGAVVSDAKGNILSVGWNDAASTEGNECISCIRRSFLKLISREDEMAYSYYELNQTQFREKLINIMKQMCLIKEDDIEEEELIATFRKKVESIAQGVPLAFCFKDIYSAMINDHNQIHTRAQHGEENALEACDKGKCSGGTLYTTSSSCELCAKKALSYNIRRIVYIEPYSGITNEHVLGHAVENGVLIRRDKTTRRESMKVELFTGATQSAYTRLYSPVFPLKDELALRGIDLK